MAQETAQRQMLRLAIRHGQSSRGNRRIGFIGTYKELPSFEFGSIPVMTGKLTCWYYSSAIFSVDFDNKRITDFGMEGYSVSTDNNIYRWRDALRELLKPYNERAFCISSEALWSGRCRWTSPARGGSKFLQVLFERFRRRAPWAYQDQNMVWWFDWELYDTDLEEVYFNSCSDLCENQDWRYYTYDWDAQGKWSKRFISADAERRYLANKKKKKRDPRGNIP